MQPNGLLLLGQLAKPILVLALKLEPSRAMLQFFKPNCDLKLRLARFPARLEAGQTLRVNPLSLALTCRSLFTSLIDYLDEFGTISARSVNSSARSRLRFRLRGNTPLCLPEIV